jgi:hypothetical protein
LDGYSEIPPIDVSHFQAELDRACKDRGVRLRIRWSPSLTVRRIGGATFKKYPDPNVKELQSFLKGYEVRRDGVKVGYKTVGGIEIGSMNGLFVPDTEKVQAALAFFVIETRLNDSYAKLKHSQHRYIYPNGWKVDALGEFTEEHAWVWAMDISEHKDGCCEKKEFCRGVYKEPNNLDLEHLRRAIWEGHHNPRKKELDGMARPEEIAQAVKEDAYLQSQDEERLVKEMALALDEDLALAMKPDVAPSVYVDLRGLK